MSVVNLQEIRDRVIPMFEVVAAEYGPRTPKGYPEVLDNPDQGVVGLLLDPAFSLNFVSDGTTVYADLMARSSRTDARSSAGRAKYSGTPFHDRRPLPENLTDTELRNLISELLSRWNMQPLIVHITDT